MSTGEVRRRRRGNTRQKVIAGLYYSAAMLLLAATIYLFLDESLVRRAGDDVNPGDPPTFRLYFAIAALVGMVGFFYKAAHASVGLSGPGRSDRPDKPRRKRGIPDIARAKDTATKEGMGTKSWK